MKNRIISRFALLLTLFVVVTACNKTETETTPPPTIELKGDEVIFTVKMGRNLDITPPVTNDKKADYLWTIDDKIVGREKTYSFIPSEIGSTFLTFSVTTKSGKAEIELRVDVARLTPPSITLTVPDGGYKMVIGDDLALKPDIKYDNKTHYRWSVDGKELSVDKNFIFTPIKSGTYKLTLVATNEDGTDELSFDVTAYEPEELPFSWEFERTAFTTASGRAIPLTPYAIKNSFNATYTWRVDGVVKQTSKEPLFAFIGNQRTEPYSVSVTMKNEFREISQNLTVEVYGAEGSFMRPSTSQSKAQLNRVFEFTPAPGQFINEYYTATTVGQACDYAQSRLLEQLHVSLGGFGGYIVVGFDHSIVNDGGYNIQIYGNSFKGSSEPGIVYVMQDENGNSIPDDQWYELKGSEYDNKETTRGYEVTYYRPFQAGQSVQWSDNKGASGTIDYLPSFHTQDYYYPLWITSDSYTLRGTRLPSKVREVSPGYWSNDAYEWGYADNFSPIDRLTDDENVGAGTNINHFKISDAMTFDRKPANLKYIDFVKIVTCVNAKAGWLGENSTEVFNIKDYNLVKKGINDKK